MTKRRQYSKNHGSSPVDKTIFNPKTHPKTNKKEAPIYLCFVKNVLCSTFKIINVLEKLLPGLTRGQKFQKRNSEAEMEFFTKPQIFQQKAAKRGIVRNQHKTECDLWLVTRQSNWDLFRL